MNRFRYIFFLQIIVLLFLFCSEVHAQHNQLGRVLDVNSQQPLSGVEVYFQGSNNKVTTDHSGRFLLSSNIDSSASENNLVLEIEGSNLIWYTASNSRISIFNLLGKPTGIDGKSEGGIGVASLDLLSNGLFFVRIESPEFIEVRRLLRNNQSFAISLPSKLKKNDGNNSVKADSLIFVKEGYFIQKYASNNVNSTYYLLKQNDTDVDYLNQLIRSEAFELLESDPLGSTYSEVKSLKIVYSIADEKLYYTNSQKYHLHYDFCTDVLGYSKGHATFNYEQYTTHPNRQYILGTLNHFMASDTYVLEFLAGDEITCDDIETVFQKVCETGFFGDYLWFYANTTNRSACVNVPVISPEELYAGQNYQPLNVQEAYGYLRKIPAEELKNSYLGRHDIVLLNTIPGEIAVVAGIITTEFQTPLSHINVLSHNRGTPNMALRDGWTNPALNIYIDKLVYLKVGLDSFIVREATLDEATEFWAKKEPQTVHKLELDTVTSGLIDLENANVNWVSTIGGKAANFAELVKVNVPEYDNIPLPENHFAIPFYYYRQHMKNCGLDTVVNNMLANEQFKIDIVYRKEKLKQLRDKIKDSPLDADFLQAVLRKMENEEGFTNFRFRSSTNAEDVEGFNGAGLYGSFTGSLSNPEKPVEKAIKKVWASLWDFAAFEERDYFKIDHETIAMGILVHRSYPAEMANGVAITENIYNPYYPAVSINVQFGEISVVNPSENYLPDQILYYTRNDLIEYVNHSTVPGMHGQTVMTDAELKQLKIYCMAIHNHYCVVNLECNPMDIEFKVDLINGQRKLYIKQARLY